MVGIFQGLGGREGGRREGGRRGGREGGREGGGGGGGRRECTLIPRSIPLKVLPGLPQ